MTVKETGKQPEEGYIYVLYRYRYDLKFSNFA